MGSDLSTKCVRLSEDKRSNLIKAELYLRAVLPTLVDLVELDAESKNIIDKKSLSIIFNLRKGSKTLLKIDNGKIYSSINPAESGDIHLLLMSPEHALGVFEQAKLPLILKGFTKISFLKNEFNNLSKRLEYFLKPSGNLELDERKISVALRFKVALRAGEVLGEIDPICQNILKSTPSGILMIKIKELDFETYFGSINGKWKYMEKLDNNQVVTSILSFNKLEIAEAMLSNKLDTFSALGLGNMEIWGLIPIIDNIGLVLGRINKYMS